MISSYGLTGSFITSALGAIAATIAIVFVWVQIPGLLALWHFGSGIQTAFGVAYRFWWLIVAYIALAFARS